MQLFVSILQYPGVAESINSDINNLVSLLKVWDILPKGWFVYLNIWRRFSESFADILLCSYWSVCWQWMENGEATVNGW